MTLNDIREIYAAHGFYHAEESIQQADLPADLEKELKAELWRLSDAEVTIDWAAIDRHRRENPDAK